MPRKQSDLFEAALVDQAAMRSRAVSLPDCVLLLDAIFAAAEFEFGASGVQVGNLVLHGFRLLRVLPD